MCEQFVEVEHAAVGLLDSTGDEMPLLKIEKLSEGLAGDWPGYLRDWDRGLRSGNYPETTRYNYLLAAAQLGRYLGEHHPIRTCPGITVRAPRRSGRRRSRRSSVSASGSDPAQGAVRDRRSLRLVCTRVNLLS